MRVRSLGLHTDLALHAWRGRVRDGHDHLVVTHPDNPRFRWGNALFFERPPEEGDLSRWCDLFDASVGAPPRITHRAFGWDGLDGDEGDVAPFLAAGFVREHGLVMAAAHTLPPERPRRDLLVRTLAGDADWAAATAGQLGAFHRTPHSEDHVVVTRLMAAYRRIVEASHGVWWGAFDGASLVGNLGLFRIGELARFQAVVTDGAWRRRGVASTVVHQAAEAARQDWGSELVLLEADPDGPARGLYERLAFAAIERRVGVSQFPRSDAASDALTPAEPASPPA